MSANERGKYVLVAQLWIIIHLQAIVWVIIASLWFSNETVIGRITTSTTTSLDVCVTFVHLCMAHC